MIKKDGAGIVEAGPQLVLGPHHRLQGRLHQAVHLVDVLRQTLDGVLGLGVLHKELGKNYSGINLHLSSSLKQLINRSHFALQTILSIQYL